MLLSEDCSEKEKMKKPDCLGIIYIIQKEFSGFDDTNERLDKSIG